jgi:hypothetical protein
MPRASIGLGPARIGSGCCLPLVMICSLVAILVIVPVAFAKSPKQYILKHPKHEHCKSHYVKKTKKGKIFCVYVTPKRAPAPTVPDPTVTTPSIPTSTPMPAPAVPAPTSPPKTEPKKEPVKESPKKEEPTKPSGPVSTTTTLNVSVRECNLLDDGIVDQCIYNLSISVSSAGGSVSSPSPNFIFTNPGKPDEGWKISEIKSLELTVNDEEFRGITSTSLTNSVYGLIAEAPGKAPWEVTATYSGSSGYSSSQSESKKVS